tara:strand:- start:69 stop:599 length:531 start_codon:yes stop_codon:yes gene_type:complete
MQFSNLTNQNSGAKLKSLSPILGLYFYTLGTLMLGFSIYLFTLINDPLNTLTAWTGQTIFWSLIIFFASLFLLFLPTEFFNSTEFSNNNFSELVVNIMIVILVSLMSLLLSQFLSQDSKIFYEIRSLVRSVSFSGFITIPFVLFIFQNFLNKFIDITNYSFHLLLLVWILSSQLFL